MLRDWLRQLKYSIIKWRHGPKPNATPSLAYFSKLREFIDSKLIGSHYDPLVAKAHYVELRHENAMHLLSTLRQISRLVVKNKDISDGLLVVESISVPLYDWLITQDGREVYPDKYILTLLDESIELVNNIVNAEISDASRDYFKRKASYVLADVVEVTSALIELTH